MSSITPPSQPSSSSPSSSSSSSSIKISSQYAGFAAGVLSGWTKLVVGQPIDIIKTRIQCSPPSTYPGGAWECFMKTISKEGPRALYKGSSAPAVGWTLTDGILMGSLNNYRSFLLASGFCEPIPAGVEALQSVEQRKVSDKNDGQRLTLLGHCMAGTAAGWSNAPVAHFIETIKARLQLQYSLGAGALAGEPAAVIRQAHATTSSIATSIPAHRTIHTSSNVSPNSGAAASAVTPSIASTRPVSSGVQFYSGPIDVIRQTVSQQGILGMWRGFGASLLFRSNFAWMFGGFEVFKRTFDSFKGTRWEISQGTSNFLSGGLASQAYWLGALPFDNVKNRIMVDSLDKPKYRGILHAFQTVLHERDLPERTKWRNALAGGANFYRGIIPVALRAFPTNAAALFVWEKVMKSLT